jgi:hypothetical protein
MIPKKKIKITKKKYDSKKLRFQEYYKILKKIMIPKNIIISEKKNYDSEKIIRFKKIMSKSIQLIQLNFCYVLQHVALAASFKYRDLKNFTSLFFFLTITMDKNLQQNPKEKLDFLIKQIEKIQTEMNSLDNLVCITNTVK